MSHPGSPPPLSNARTRSAGDAPGVLAIHGMFFLSGMGALVFENVWFDQIGLIVGNSVWSAALVVGAFMAGLALGNGAAVMLAKRWRNLVRGYGLLESVAALSGAAAVCVFPLLPAVFHPLLAPFLDETGVLNIIRTGIAFGLMVIPATALGTSLPLLSKPVESATGSYGFALGRLYGVNTLGAVAGTLSAELFLVPALGLRNSGLFAAACNVAAALIALRIARRATFAESRAAPAGAAVPLTRESKRIVAAAFLSGGILLALEVIWFRFLLLFQSGTTLMFAIMLAVVLAGIGLGGMIASRWSQHGWRPGTVARLAAAGAVAAVVAGYAGFHSIVENLGVMAPADSTQSLVLLSLFLMGPVCLLSGVLFTALGDHLRARMADAATTTGVLTLANTLGAMAGSLLAAFVLLPGPGLEASFFVAAVAYVATVVVVPDASSARRWRVAPVLAAGTVLAVFPFGTMKNVHYRAVERDFDAHLVAAREGIVQTTFYLAHRFGGETLYHRLVTNSYSMSSTAIQSQRYMKLFAYLPAAFHPGIERVLLICFGVGSTASAITELPDVRAVDVVDVSRDVLEMSDIAHPDPRRHPLRDRRVSIHVEDGRFFLQHTDRSYDLITGEPPPPKMAGVASLYTEEYFRLLRHRLNPGGLATYWLPTNQLLPSDALAIVRAFCDVFDDCSLWSGMGFQWILMGSRGGIAPVSRERFSRLWTVPQTAEELREIAIDTPEQLVAQFMADATLLREVTAGTLPLVDDFPQRISSAQPTRRAEPLYARLMDAERNRERLESSSWISKILPRSLIADSRDRFRERAMLDQEWAPELRGPDYNLWSNLEELIRRTDRVTWPRWLLGSEARMAEIAGRRSASNPFMAEHLAIDALVNRVRPEKAIAPQRFLAMTARGQLVTIFRYCLAGDGGEARSLMASIPEKRRSLEPYRSFFSWAATGCGAERR